jgi:hypothetical protein
MTKPPEHRPRRLHSILDDQSVVEVLKALVAHLQWRNDAEASIHDQSAVDGDGAGPRDWMRRHAGPDGSGDVIKGVKLSGRPNETVAVLDACATDS